MSRGAGPQVGGEGRREAEWRGGAQGGRGRSRKAK